MFMSAKSYNLKLKSIIIGAKLEHRLEHLEIDHSFR